MSNRAEQLGYIEQFPSKKSVTSWRQEEITISGNALKTITFSETSPNMFCVQNPNDVSLLIGITKIPTETSYETRIEANNTQTFGRPVPTRTVHILNPSNKEITVTLFSVLDTFDINVMKNGGSVGGSGGGVSYDGIIKGFSNGVSLPSGDNKIGIVGVDGKVVLDDETAQDIHTVTVLLTEVKEQLAESNKGLVDFLYYERIATSDSVTIDFQNEPFVPDYIGFIANDDETNSIAVNIVFTNGNDKSLSLVKGDIFGDMKAAIRSITISPKTDDAIISWRCMFGKRG